MEFGTFNKKITALVFCHISKKPSNGAGFRPVNNAEAGKQRVIKRCANMKDPI
jgi:hypothetical protein